MILNNSTLAFASSVYEMSGESGAERLDERDFEGRASSEERSL